jgi:L-amino acid N-acyltransferase YncA
LEYVFSLAEAADAPAVFALYRGMIGTPGCTWNDSYPALELVQSDIYSQSLYILKDSQDRIVAAAAAGSKRELEDLPWDMEIPCELARVAVDLPLQNKGIGAYLLQNVIAAVKARGFDGICMLVSKSHPHAQRLYEKNGFVRCGEVSRYGFDFYRFRMEFS